MELFQGQFDLYVYILSLQDEYNRHRALGVGSVHDPSPFFLGHLKWTKWQFLDQYKTSKPGQTKWQRAGMGCNYSQLFHEVQVVCRPHVPTVLQLADHCIGPSCFYWGWESKAEKNQKLPRTFGQMMGYTCKLIWVRAKEKTIQAKNNGKDDKIINEETKLAKLQKQGPLEQEVPQGRGPLGRRYISPAPGLWSSTASRNLT